MPLLREHREHKKGLDPLPHTLSLLIRKHSRHSPLRSNPAINSCFPFAKKEQLLGNIIFIQLQGPAQLQCHATIQQSSFCKAALHKLGQVMTAWEGYLLRICNVTAKPLLPPGAQPCSPFSGGDAEGAAQHRCASAPRRERGRGRRGSLTLAGQWG